MERKTFEIEKAEIALNSMEKALIVKDFPLFDVSFTRYKNYERTYYARTEKFFPDELENKYRKLLENRYPKLKDMLNL